MAMESQGGGSATQTTSTKNRGFASMSPEKQREIARKGGRAAHEKGKAHEFTSDEARNAGRKGGEKVSVNRSHMAEIGRRGGRSSASRRRTTSGAGGGGQPGQNGGHQHAGPDGDNAGAEPGTADHTTSHDVSRETSMGS